MNRLEYLIVKYKEELNKTSKEFEESFKLFSNNQMPDETIKRIDDMMEIVKDKQYKMLRCIDAADYEDIIVLDSIDRIGDV